MGVVAFRRSQSAGIVRRLPRLYNQCGAEFYTNHPTHLNIWPFKLLSAPSLPSSGNCSKTRGWPLATGQASVDSASTFYNELL